MIGLDISYMASKSQKVFLSIGLLRTIVKVAVVIVILSISKGACGFIV